MILENLIIQLEFPCLWFMQAGISAMNFGASHKFSILSKFRQFTIRKIILVMPLNVDTIHILIIIYDGIYLLIVSITRRVSQFIFIQHCWCIVFRSIQEWCMVSVFQKKRVICDPIFITISSAANPRLWVRITGHLHSTDKFK